MEPSVPSNQALAWRRSFDGHTAAGPPVRPPELSARAGVSAAIVTLALGIGATTAIFSTLNAVLLKPLPYPDWQRHDVGTTPGFDGDTVRALRSMKARVLYMPSETDLYFPLTDARYEQAYIPRVTFTPIPSLWGHTAGAGSNPADLKFLNDRVAEFLK